MQTNSPASTVFDVLVTNRVFNTQPLVIHAHGPLNRKPAWPPIKEAVFGHPRRTLPPAPHITLLTCNNGEQGMGLFERSVELVGLPCVVSGQGVRPWVNSRDKPQVIYNALLSTETEHVLYADSRDAVLIGDINRALPLIQSRPECRLLFGGDRMNYPGLMPFRKFELSLPRASESQFCYLNGGVWFGETNFCREFFRAAAQRAPCPEAPDSEQGILKALLPDFYPAVQIDYRCELVQNIGFAQADIISIRVTSYC